MKLRFHCDLCDECHPTADAAGKCEMMHVIVAKQKAEAERKRQEAIDRSRVVVEQLPDDHPAKVFLT